MSEATDKGLRLSKVAREFNLGVHTVVEFLEKKGHKVESNPNTKIAGDLYDLLMAEFGTDKEIKAKSQQVVQQRHERETIALATAAAKAAEPKVEPKPEPKAKAEPEAPVAAPVPPPAPPAPADVPAAPVAEATEPEVIKAKAEKAGVKVVRKIDLESKAAKGKG
ncbi:MAG: translation initiation factor IF-2, partial [Flavobacteriales bacterium]